MTKGELKTIILKIQNRCGLEEPTRITYYWDEKNRIVFKAFFESLYLPESLRVDSEFIKNTFITQNVYEYTDDFEILELNQDEGFVKFVTDNQDFKIADSYTDVPKDTGDEKTEQVVLAGSRLNETFARRKKFILFESTPSKEEEEAEALIQNSDIPNDLKKARDAGKGAGKNKKEKVAIDGMCILVQNVGVPGFGQDLKSAVGPLFEQIRDPGGTADLARQATQDEAKNAKNNKDTLEVLKNAKLKMVFATDYDTYDKYPLTTDQCIRILTNTIVGQLGETYAYSLTPKNTQTRELFDSLEAEKSENNVVMFLNQSSVEAAEKCNLANVITQLGKTVPLKDPSSSGFKYRVELIPYEDYDNLVKTSTDALQQCVALVEPLIQSYAQVKLDKGGVVFNTEKPSGEEQKAQGSGKQKTDAEKEKADDKQKAKGSTGTALGDAKKVKDKLASVKIGSSSKVGNAAEAKDAEVEAEEKAQEKADSTAQKGLEKTKDVADKKGDEIEDAAKQKKEKGSRELMSADNFEKRKDLYNKALASNPSYKVLETLCMDMYAQEDWLKDNEGAQENIKRQQEAVKQLMSNSKNIGSLKGLSNLSIIKSAIAATCKQSLTWGAQERSDDKYAGSFGGIKLGDPKEEKETQKLPGTDVYHDFLIYVFTKDDGSALRDSIIQAGKLIHVDALPTNSEILEPAEGNDATTQSESEQDKTEAGDQPAEDNDVTTQDKTEAGDQPTEDTKEIEGAAEDEE